MSTRGAAMTDESRIPLKRLRLIDEHDRDVSFDRVQQPAGVAGERLGISPMLERPFALGTDENLEQVGGEAHEAAYPSRFRDGSSRRHLGNTFTWRSRNTRWPPSSASILARAAAPRALMVRPPSPMTIPF